MERRFFLAILLSFCVLYIWTLFLPKSKHPPLNSLQTFENKQIVSIQDDAVSTIQASLPATDLIIQKIEDIVSLESKEFLAKFSNIGGVLSSIELKNLKHAFPVKNVLNSDLCENCEFKIYSLDLNKLVYVYEKDGLKIFKTYTISDDFTIKANIKIVNNSDMSKQENFSINCISLKMSKVSLDPYDKTAFEYAIFDKENYHRKNNAFKFNSKENKEISQNVDLAGFRDRYFCLLVKPLFDVHGYSLKKTYEHVIVKKDDFNKILQENEINALFSELIRNRIISSNGVILENFRNMTKASELQLGSSYSGKGEEIFQILENIATRFDIKIVSKDIKTGKNGETNFSFVIFAGPENTEILKKYDLGFEKIKLFYRFGLFDVVAKILYHGMHLIHKIIPNWGVAIVLMGVLIYFLMYPLTMVSMNSMKRMQNIQPKLAELKEKYKNNPQKLNKEMIELYKIEKVNPFGGCLPILLQMPVFIGIYQVLWREAALKGAHFLWIKDLMAPDRLFIFPFQIPFFGNEFNILPIIYGILMFFQQKFSSKSMVTADPAQAEAQKMMMKIMPVMLAVVFYKFSSGLTIYFTVYFLLTTITQWKMSRI